MKNEGIKPTSRTDINKLSPVEIGRILADQRKRIGISQGDVARELGYVNMNFISMIESGRSKIPMNRVDDFVYAYRMNPEFILVILRVMYPDILDSILRLANKIPKIFKGFIKNNDEEIEEIFVKTRDLLRAH